MKSDGVQVVWVQVAQSIGSGVPRVRVQRATWAPPTNSCLTRCTDTCPDLRKRRDASARLVSDDEDLNETKCGKNSRAALSRWKLLQSYKQKEQGDKSGLGRGDTVGGVPRPDTADGSHLGQHMSQSGQTAHVFIEKPSTTVLGNYTFAASPLHTA